jgi:Kae1-associated kinase Bud32
MMAQDSDSSASGYISDSFEGISRDFTDVEILSTSEVNVVAKGKRYGRWWLLKGLRPEVRNEAGYQQRLRKELDIMMQLQHPGIVTAMGVETVEELGDCILMEYVDGVTLKEWLQATTTRKERRRIANQLTEAVSYIHSKGIVHRDLKPANIIVTRNGENVKLIDFGLADTDSHAVLKQPAGTLKYMSPEQQQTAVADVRNDIYSMGVIFQQMDLGYSRIVRRCLLPIGQRYQNVTELRDSMTRRDSRNRLLTVAILSALFLLLMVAVVGLATRQKLLSRTISQQHQTIDSQQDRIVEQKEAIEKLKEKVEESQMEADEQKETVNLLAADNRRQKERNEEVQRRKQSEYRIQRCYAEGADSLRKAVKPEVGIDERYKRGIDAIHIYMNSHTTGLTAQEKQEVERCLMSILNALRQSWQQKENEQNKQKR